MRFVISFVLIIVLLVVYRKSLFSYAGGFSLFFIISSLCFQHIYAFFSPLKFLTMGLIIFTYLNCAYGKSRKERLPHKVILLFIFYFIIEIVILFGSWIIGGLGINTQMFYLLKTIYLKFGLAFLAYFAFRRISEVERFNRYIKNGLMIISIYGIVEYFTHINIYSELISMAFPEMRETTISFYENARGVLNGRVGATLIHPLNLGQMVLLLLGYLSIIRNKLGNMDFYTTALLAFIVIVFTGSRSCIIPAVVLMVICVLCDFKNNRRTIIFLLICALFIGTICEIEVNEDVKDTIESFLFFWDDERVSHIKMGGSSVDFRNEQWLIVQEIFKNKSIWFGQGYGYMSMPEYEEWHMLLNGAESILFTFTMEQGVIGFIAFVLLILSIGFIMEGEYKKQFGQYCLMIAIFVCSYILSLLLTGDRSSSYAFFVLCAVYLRYCILLRLEGGRSA